MWFLRLVRNFALLAVLALAAHVAAGADKHGNPHCGGFCNASGDCRGACTCLLSFNYCVPKQH